MHTADESLSDTEADGERLLPAQPPSTFMLERAWVLDSPEQLSPLRKAILATIAGDGSAAGALDDVAENMVLIASELATNALRYAYPPTVVRVLRDGNAYLLDVEDHAPDTVPDLATGRPEGEGGLGMQIARRLALDVGWYAQGSAKHVWAILPASA